VFGSGNFGTHATDKTETHDIVTKEYVHLLHLSKIPRENDNLHGGLQEFLLIMLQKLCSYRLIGCISCARRCRLISAYCCLSLGMERRVGRKRTDLRAARFSAAMAGSSRLLGSCEVSPTKSHRPFEKVLSPDRPSPYRLSLDQEKCDHCAKTPADHMRHGACPVFRMRPPR